MSKNTKYRKNVYNRSECAIERKSECKKNIFLPFQKGRSSHSYIFGHDISKRHVFRGWKIPVDFPPRRIQ
jgi:hypothetical protein